MSAYESGTVASLTISGETVRGVVSLDGNWIVFGHSFFKGIAQNNDHYITDVRPLVVLDIPNRATAEDIARVLRAEGYGQHADQIEAQTKPPRIPEPGWGGIVRSTGTTVIGEPVRWVRGDKGWTNLDAPGAFLNWTEWDELHDPTLIREGVQS